MENKKFERSRDLNLSEKDKQITEGVESLPLADGDKTDLILVLHDLKEATNIRISSQHLQQCIDTLKKVNLEVATEKESDEVSELYVAKTRENAEKLKAAWAIYDDAELGRMSGYPKSAVEAFVRVKKITGSPEEVIRTLADLFIDKHELPQQVQGQDYLAFLGFKLSRAGFQSELEVLRKWARTIKKYDPELYRRVIKSDKFD